jgi:hypothetical protein
MSNLVSLEPGGMQVKDQQINILHKRSKAYQNGEYAFRGILIPIGCS